MKTMSLTNEVPRICLEGRVFLGIRLSKYFGKGDITVMVLVFQHLLYLSALTFFIPSELLLVVFPNRGLELLETL